MSGTARLRIWTLQCTLGLAAFLLAGLTFISGFSSGAAYVLPSALLLLAAVLAMLIGTGEPTIDGR